MDNKELLEQLKKNISALSDEDIKSVKKFVADLQNKK